MKFSIEPVQCDPNIVHLADAIVVLTLAQSRAAKIEPQNRKTEAVQRLHGVKNNFVVDCASVERVRMTNQSSMGGGA